MNAKSPLIYGLLTILFLINALHAQSLRDKIGQMMMVGFYQNSNFMDTLWVDITQRNLGGVVLFGSNIQNPIQIQNLTAQLQQAAPTSLFIATDQEGGYVARLKASNGFANTYSAYTLGTIFNSEDSTRATAGMMAQWLEDSGINVNLAPVVDVNVNPLSPAIGFYERSFSSDPMTVFNHASWFADEFKQKQIITALKHYPGHGSAEEDSHLGFTDITETWADSELVPYQQLIGQGYADLIMSGHLFNANLDSLYPASLSYNTITGLLKDSLGFSGAVISDEMLMGAIVNNYGFDQAIELAINAGTDILLYRTNERNNFSLVRQVIDIVEQKVNAGMISLSRIDDAYDKILALKQSITALPEPTARHQIPQDFNLINYPNPFNNSTTIEFSLPESGFVTLKIYNLLGQETATIVSAKLVAGNYQYRWNASSLASGIYYYRLESGGFQQANKMILLK
ncbi:MAG: T9SS type A sorting domain-containing protein [Calditrichaeota bacterium]|nr:T9SS type A sorting domain-containing protein [Calditrichota bacterium]MCB0303252.1 T9SS type A sorting domain-containing protein [Calditrichota bacterium]